MIMIPKTVNPEQNSSSKEAQRMAQERVSKIQEHTEKLKKAEGISEYEKEPAYKRRSIDLDKSKPERE